VQPGARVLGRAGSGRHPFFRTHRAATPRGHPPSAGFGGARSLFARGEQLRLLAGRRAGAHPAYYAYAYPEPAGFKDTTIRPAGALYSEELGEFLLPYDAVRESPSPDDTLLEFLQTTYEAAADLGKWDRAALESHTPIRR
jgi:hypothetical protein